MSQQVILVNQKDKRVGAAEKLKTHQLGLLHRAFSVFIFNSKNELMIQKRASGKYHSSGLWSNTCCSHPRPGKNITTEAKKRLKEEMGFSCDLKKISKIIYQKNFSNGLTENEYDHIFSGYYDKKPQLNPKEAADWKWTSLLNLRKNFEKNPEKYTYWFKLILSKKIF